MATNAPRRVEGRGDRAHDVRRLLETMRDELERTARLPVGRDEAWRVGLTYARLSLEDALAHLPAATDPRVVAAVRFLPNTDDAAPRRKAS